MAEHKMVTLTMADDAKKALPLSLHEKMIARHFSDPGDEVLIGLRDAMQAGRLAVEKASRVTEASLKNQLRTKAANMQAARTASFSLLEGATKRFDTALGRARGALADIAKRTAGPLRAQDTLGALEAQELRAVLARMEPKQRAAAISAHLLADDVFASAVLNARPLLSGLDPTEHAIHLHAGARPVTAPSWSGPSGFPRLSSTPSAAGDWQWSMSTN